MIKGMSVNPTTAADLQLTIIYLSINVFGFHCILHARDNLRYLIINYLSNEFKINILLQKQNKILNVPFIDHF